MRLVTLGGIGALACAAVALACSDQPSAPQARLGIAEGSVLRIHGAGTFTIHTAHGPVVHTLPAWSASGAVKNGIAHEDGAAPVLGVLGVRSGAFASAATEGKHRTATFVDPSGARHDVVWINSPDGSPPRKVGHFIDGKLVTVTEYAWTATNGGWVVASVAHTSYRDGKPATEGRISAAGLAEVASHPGAAAAGALALRALSWIAPADANAQVFSGPCRMEWLAYIAAQAALSAATIALEVTPTNPVLYAAWLAAAAAATIAEMKLWLCEQNQESKNDPFPHGGASGGKPNTTPLTCLIDPTGPGCGDNPSDAL